MCIFTFPCFCLLSLLQRWCSGLRRVFKMVDNQAGMSSPTNAWAELRRQPATVLRFHAPKSICCFGVWSRGTRGVYVSIMRLGVPNSQATRARIVSLRGYIYDVFLHDERDRRISYDGIQRCTSSSINYLTTMRRSRELHRMRTKLKVTEQSHRWPSCPCYTYMSRILVKPQSWSNMRDRTIRKGQVMKPAQLGETRTTARRKAAIVSVSGAGYAVGDDLTSGEELV